jgi:hypothetical protein
MQATGERRATAPTHLWPRHWGNWSASRPVSSLRRKRTPVPIVQEAGCASELVWTQRLEEKSFATAGNPTPVVQCIVTHYTDWKDAQIQSQIFTKYYQRDRSAVCFLFDVRCCAVICHVNSILRFLNIENFNFNVLSVTLVIYYSFLQFCLSVTLFCELQFTYKKK